MSKKVKLTIVLVVVAIAVAGGVFLIFHNCSTTLKDIYEENWDIELPSKLKQVEKFSTPAGGMGDGLKYSLYVDKSENHDYYNDFVEDKDKVAQNKIKKFVEFYQNGDSVIEGKRFEFDYEYKCKIMNKNDHDWLVMIWIPEYNELMIVQDTM